VLFLGGCAGQQPPSIQTGPDADVVMGNLNRVDNARADFVYVDPAIDYGRYQGLLLEPLDLDHVEIRQPDGSQLGTRIERPWTLTDSDRDSLRASFDEIMRRELGADGAFRLSDEPADDVLRVEAMLTRIAPNAPKDDVRTRSTARTIVYTQGTGSLSIELVLTDSLSGEVLALLKDTRDGETTMFSMNTRVGNLNEVRRIFSGWGRRLQSGLLGLRARPPGGAQDRR
jgi:hypothetical protein